MKQKQQLTSQEQQQVSETQEQKTEGREFATPEELLRHDAAQTPVPEAVAERLEKSISKLPPPPQSWWRRIFGGGKQ